ncbi:MAG: glycosyltransferase family 39 protein [Planctomycetes bacterium]|nr:glycosyltransferase family 39 protein [Planctomycetota bacterium]
MARALLLFLLALLPRLLFWQATEDRELAWSLCFVGDAPVWQAQAGALAASESSRDENLSRELSLPLRPPAMTWVVSALWDGRADGAWKVRVVFALLGALVAPLLYLLARKRLGERAALLAGVLGALATNLILLSSGPHSEILYLVLLLATLFDQERLREAPTSVAALRWGALHALLCLVRVEHLLTFAALAALLVIARAPRWKTSLGLASAALLVVLLPYQLHALEATRRYQDDGGPALPRNAGRPPQFLDWQPDALARLEATPRCARAATLAFLDATMRTRGARRVTAADFDVLRQAYGALPEPLPTPFVALYGGLNFFLANSKEADGGFSNEALHRPPPLEGGDALYPPGLRDVLPKEGELNLGYPPHLHALRHGYALGFAELTGNPGDALARCGKKLLHAAEGAGGGLGAAGLPVGLGGVRRSVDLATPQQLAGRCASAAWIALGLLGLWRVRRTPSTWPWLAIVATKLAVVLAFFGYARHGALLQPFLILGVAALAAPWFQRDAVRRRVRWAGATLALGMLAYDAQRTLRGAELALDGQRVSAESAAEDRGHRARQLEVSR